MHPGVDLAKIRAIGLPDRLFTRIAAGNRLQLLAKRRPVAARGPLLASRGKTPAFPELDGLFGDV